MGKSEASSSSSSSSNPSSSGSSTVQVEIQDPVRSYQLSLLKPSAQKERQKEEIANTPIFTAPHLDRFTKNLLDGPESPFPQHGLLAGVSEVLNDEKLGEEPHASTHLQDPRVFFNTTVPSSIFICGSQGSGKSHTLSCLLENCLIPSNANKLHNPLAGLVFHYDTFISDQGGTPCEAAHLASDPNIKVRILCSPTNLRTIQHTYQSLNVTVEPLRIRQTNLNTKRMLDLMAVSSNDGPVPLYLHTVYRVLREMRITQQETGDTFNYCEFKEKVLDSSMTPAQLGPLNQRLDTLESFMPASEIVALNSKLGQKSLLRKKKAPQEGNDWTSKPGCLTIVDLSCPCVTPEGACSLFNICLSLFLEQDPKIGRVIALDEAHKFMNTSAEAQTLTNTLLSTIRLQRHLGARVIISTQEPTISPALLDLCSVTIVHRFSSPEWMRSLRNHLAGAASHFVETDPEDSDADGNDKGKKGTTKDLFSQVIKLKVGQALLFSPSAIVGWKLEGDGREVGEVKRLGAGFLNIQMRSRITEDGGKSIMAP